MSDNYEDDEYWNYHRLRPMRYCVFCAVFTKKLHCPECGIPTIEANDDC